MSEAETQVSHIRILFVFSDMGSLKIHDINTPYQSIAAERELGFYNLTSEEKFYALLKLNKIAVKLNGGRPLKTPQGKGIIIRKPKP